MTKFGYPDTLVKNYGAWAVLVRPGQATLGALVLVCREPVQAFSQVSPEAMTVLGQVISDAETCLSGLWSYDKINYLMLMMVDPDVHFHVIPRYATGREFDGITIEDTGWPAVPDIAASPDLGDERFNRLVRHIVSSWPG